MTLEPQALLGGVRVLRADGELDVRTADELLPAVPTLVDGARAVVLDLTAVTFFDSSGCRLVDRLGRETSRRGAGFRVVAPPGGPSRRVLELVGMAEALADDSLDAALAVLADPAG